MQSPKQILVACLLLTSLAVSLTQALQITWTKVDGVSNQASVAVGPSGLWALSEDGSVYYRTNTYDNLWIPVSGEDWEAVNGQNLKQLDVGHNIAWGVATDGSVFYRKGINSDFPSGLSWERVDGRMSHVSVDFDNNVWAINSSGAVFRREDDAWTEVPGKLLSTLDVGMSGVWGLDASGNVYYRNGTYNNFGSSGIGWTQMTDQKLSAVSSGGQFIICGADPEGNVYQWSDSEWEMIDQKSQGRVVSLDIFLYSLYALNENGDVLFVDMYGL